MRRLRMRKPARLWPWISLSAEWTIPLRKTAGLPRWRFLRTPALFCFRGSELMSENGGDDDDFADRRPDRDRDRAPRRGGQREFGSGDSAPGGDVGGFGG